MSQNTETENSSPHIEHASWVYVQVPFPTAPPPHQPHALTLPCTDALKPW